MVLRVLWVLLAASSRPRSLQDELDELWPLFSFGGASVGGIGFSSSCAAGWFSFRPSSFTASGPSSHVSRQRPRTDLDFANTCSLPVFPARYDMFFVETS